MKNCRVCKKSLPLEMFHTDRSRPDGKHSKCKDCTRQYHREWRSGNPEKAREKWRRASQGHYSRNARRRHLRKYGLKPQDYLGMLEQQGGKCAICGAEPEKLCVDHDHRTGVIRGLLCDSCNRGIGQMRDDPERLLSAYRYLTEPLIRKVS